MSTNTVSVSSRKSSKYLLQPTKKPLLGQNELSEISEQEKEAPRIRNQADILREIILEKNKEIAVLKMELERLKSSNTQNLVLARPNATGDSYRQRERNPYNYAKSRHKRIFSMGQYGSDLPHTKLQVKQKRSLYE